MGYQPIVVQEFSSAFKASETSCVEVAKRVCYDLENEPPHLVASYPVDSGPLMDFFDLSKSAKYEVKVSLYDFTSDKYLDESVAVRVGLDALPHLSVMFFSESPVIDLFTPEFVLTKFGKVTMRRSAYCEILKYLQEKNFMLYFSGYLQFEATPNSKPGNGMLTISANIPPFNYLFGHLNANGYLK